jgi:uncharacterized membrane protein
MTSLPVWRRLLLLIKYYCSYHQFAVFVAVSFYRARLYPPGVDMDLMLLLLLQLCCCSRFSVAPSRRFKAVRNLSLPPLPLHLANCVSGKSTSGSYTGSRHWHVGPDSSDELLGR